VEAIRLPGRGEGVAAISSISATQRQLFASAERVARACSSASPGSDRAHSATSASSTPSARAVSRTARRSAAVPFVHAAYAIFTAEASPIRSETTGASSTVPAKSSPTPAADGPDR
jgi:hypothetical protein